MDVAVVGAGLGGLAVAIGLRRAGHAVTVFERAAEPRETGAGIGIMPNGVQALDTLGLGAPLRTRATPLEAGIIRDRHGRPLLAADHDTLLRHTRAPLVVVPRRWLHTMLLGAAGPGILRTGQPVREVRESGTGVEIDGGGRFDAVIAADGANSRLRAALFPAFPGLRGSGEYAARAIAPGPPGVTPVSGELLDRRTGERFGCMPMADGTVYWYATWHADRLTAATDLPRWLRDRRADWHPSVPALIGATAPADVHVVETAQLVHPLPALAVGRVALLGDAAHAMTPDLGQGAGQAFEDAATLAALFDGLSPDAVPAALGRYDAVRRPRTSALQRAARRAHRLLGLRGPAAHVRDLGLRLIPGALAARAMSAQLRFAAPAPHCANGTLAH